MDGILRALPYAAIPFLFGFILENSGNEIRLSGQYIKFGAALSGVILVLMSLYEWSRKKHLFQVHFRVDLELRNRLCANLPWLLASQLVSLVLIGWTRARLEADPDYSALAVFGFLLGAISISYFAFKLAWKRSAIQKHYRGDNEGFYLRYEKWFFFIAISFPLMTALIAMFGYLETARLLLSRFFLSFCILLAAYIMHGLLRRTVVIAPRRLALEQARARRDANVKARREKVAAEERGEIPVPKIDTESIDLETINRQSSQLVNVMVFIVTIIFLWSLWSNLLPALSIFDTVDLWKYTDEDGKKNAITLWNAMQALAIGIVTWLAARNLPGFLEIFVLKRLNMAQSSRFAVVTVLGYIIFILGIVVAFNKLGTQWSQLQWIVAALGVGIGFGLQAIFANMISGLIILFERPIRIGDYITIGDISGTVSRIQIRATTLLDLDNKEILIPNQEIISSRVTNWTLSNSVTRLIINVGIAYGSDTERAHKIMLQTIKDNANVLNHPEPSVLFLGFGASSLDFEVRVFLRDFVQRFRVSHELHLAIDMALREADITIAFPQLDVHVKEIEATPMMIENTPTKPKPRARKKS
ncbi:MAG TPA: mechanosensitive ion channel [Hellea balneolensis]|uniref:Mechanosensitive ion channel n=1 Tax=Hellea balneolensis TaxID=287478 RepID=A0A7C5LSI5_9PROT|nr:mechanosensitive ion channel [Hellea balneolensis]